MPASAPYVKFLVELQGGTGPIRLCTPQLFQDVQPWRHNSCLRAENHPNRRIVRQTAFMRLWPGVAAPGPVGKNVGAGRQRSGADRACRQGPRHGTGRTPGDGFAAAGASGPRHLHIAFRGLGQGGVSSSGVSCSRSSALLLPRALGGVSRSGLSLPGCPFFPNHCGRVLAQTEIQGPKPR